MWSEILKIANEIYIQVNAAKGNQKQVSLLGERIRVLLHAIEGADDIKDNQQFDEPLQALLNTLKNCKELLVNFQDINWFVRLAKARSYKKDFEEIRTQLLGVTGDLNLSMAMQAVMNRENDQEAIIADMQSLKISAAEILELEQEALSMLSDLKIDRNNTEVQLLQLDKKMQKFADILSTHLQKTQPAHYSQGELIVLAPGASARKVTHKVRSETHDHTLPPQATRLDMKNVKEMMDHASKRADERQASSSSSYSKTTVVSAGANADEVVVEDNPFIHKLNIGAQDHVSERSPAHHALLRETNKRSAQITQRESDEELDTEKVADSAQPNFM